MKLFDIKKKEVTIASLFQRSLATIADLALVFLVGLGAATLIQSAVEKSPSVDAYVQAYYDECEASNLFEVDRDKSEVNVHLYSSYEEYNTTFMYFYSTYLPSKETPNYTHDVYWYNVHVLGLDDVKNIYSNDDLSSRNSFFLTGKDLFEYFGTSYDEIAIPKVCNQNKNTVLTSEQSETLRKHFHLKSTDEENNKNNCVYYHIINEFSLIDDVTYNFSNYKLYAYSLPTYGSLFFFSLVFFFIIPLFTKRGKTLGKLMFGLSVLNTECYECNRVQASIRTLPIVVFTIVVFLMFGFNAITLGIVSVLILFSFLVMIFSKDKQALHDKFFMTIVIKDKDSFWYKDEKQELEYKEK